VEKAKQQNKFDPVFSAWRFESWLLYVVAAAIGVLAALAAVGFERLIHWTSHFCYGDGSHTLGLYNGQAVMLFVLPAAGALIVGLIARFYTREAVGHGVPEVMDAIVRRGGVIKFHLALGRMITAAVTIGSGGSAGTEGPIIQIGAAIASSLGSACGVLRHQLPVVVACGAAAGLSAIFNAPIAGVLFAVEVFLRDVNFKTLCPILIASVISSVTASELLGKHDAIFPLGQMAIYSFHWKELANYVLLGLVCAATAVGFIRSMYAVDGVFDRIKLPTAVKPALGALGVGAIGLAMLWLAGGAPLGKPLVFGHGYSFIGYCIGAPSEARFADVPLTALFLLALTAAKIAATSLTLGSGGSGGIFAPSLFLGATVGYAFGLLMRQFGLFADVNPATYSLVGMASVMAATTHAPMASIVLLFELTRNYSIILPVMFSATIALLVGQKFCRYSIASMKLYQEGIDFALHTRTALLRRFTAAEIMQPSVVTITAEASLRDIIVKTADEQASDFVVVDKAGKYCGLLCEKDLRNILLHPEAIPVMNGFDLARPDVPAVLATDTLDKILELFSQFDVNSLPVFDAEGTHRWVGMVTRAELLRRYRDELQKG